MRADEPIRFLVKVKKREDGCWQWTGYIDPQGYGRFKAADEQRAHRWSYKHYVGAIPDGLVIDHECRNRSCVNPDHLRAVTSRENSFAPGSVAPAKLLREAESCTNGHPWDAENTRMTRKGYRYCLLCQRDRSTQQRAKAKTTVCSQGHQKKTSPKGTLYCPICASEARKRPPKPPPTTFACGHLRSQTGAVNRVGVEYCQVCRSEKRKRPGSVRAKRGYRY